MAAGDRQTYNRIAATVEAKMVSWIAAMLTDTISMPKDGPYVTADNDAAGKSPVNVGLKDLANMLTGLAGSIYGNVMGVNIRSLKSLLVDGTGGAISAISGGVVAAIASLQVLDGATIQSLLNNGSLQFWDTVASGANPVYTWSAPNQMDALMMPKTQGNVLTDGAGAVSVSDGGRISGVALPGGNIIRVTFASAFDNANYSIVFNAQIPPGSPGTGPLHPTWTQSTTKCEFDFSATGKDVTTDVIQLNFNAFGRQTT